MTPLEKHALTPSRQRMAVGLLLFTTLALAAGSAAQKSVTVDEYQALPHGLALCKTGDFHLATGVPLLPSILPALPLLATDAQFDVTAMPRYASSWECGLQFVIENGFDRDPQTGRYFPSGRYHDSFLLGRAVSIAVLLATAGLVYGFARSLYGPHAALLSLAVACFSPNLLAHGRLVTPDIYLAAALVGCLWSFDRLLLRPTWAAASMLGLCLGLAALCKLTGLLLFSLFPLYLLLPGARRSWRLLIASLCLGLLVVNAGYLFDGSCTPIGRFSFDSPQMKALANLLPGWLPVPLPRYFFQGVDAQLAESGYTAYLMGDFNSTGFYSYYVVGLLVKTPVPVLLLAGLAWLCGGRPSWRELPLLLTAGLLLLFFSLAGHKNIGLRYVLFLEPLTALWIGRLLAEPRVSATWLRRTILVAVVCLGGIALASWPHYLPYFNWLSGGPDRGHRWLLDSNLDWGQDLVALRRYLQQEEISEIDLAYFGRVPPEVYGIRYRTLRASEAPKNRYVAISANLLCGLMYIVNGDLNYWPDDADGYAAFRTRKPAAILGHSIYVFDMLEAARK